MNTSNQFEISFLITTIFVYLLGFSVYFGFKKKKTKERKNEFTKHLIYNSIYFNGTYFFALLS